MKNKINIESFIPSLCMADRQFINPQTNEAISVWFITEENIFAIGGKTSQTRYKNINTFIKELVEFYDNGFTELEPIKDIKQYSPIAYIIISKHINDISLETLNLIKH